jgi:hypothetical protein
MTCNCIGGNPCPCRSRAAVVDIDKLLDIRPLGDPLSHWMRLGRCEDLNENVRRAALFDARDRCRDLQDLAYDVLFDNDRRTDGDLRRIKDEVRSIRRCIEQALL